MSGIVELDKDGNRISDSCDVLLNGSGVVNKPKCVYFSVTLQELALPTNIAKRARNPWPGFIPRCRCA